MDKAGDVLQQLADNLGVAAEQLWPVLVRQQVTEGWGLIAWGVMFTAVCVYCVWWGNRELKSELPPDGKGLGCYVFTCIVVCSPAPFLFSMGISRLLNPEYFAFRDILRML